MLEIFRKIREGFSLAHCDLPTMFKHSAFLLRTLSINIDPRHEKKIPLIIPFLNIIVAASFFYVYLISMLWFVFGRCAQNGDVLLAIIVLSLGLGSHLGPVKLIFLFCNKDKLQELVSHCLVCDGLVEPGSRFQSNLIKMLCLVKKRAVVFWSVIMANGLVYIMKPIILPGRRLMEDFFVFYGLEPMFKTPNYEIAFTLNSLAVFYACYLPSNTTAIQIISSGYIEAQLLAWSEELVNLWDDANKHYLKRNSTEISFESDIESYYDDRNFIMNKYVNQRLKVIVKAHAGIINLFIMTHKIFTDAIAVEFFILMVCLVAELLGGLENTYMEVPFALVQIGMDCFIGQRITDASLVFKRAVYDCRWENFDNENMKVVKIMSVISNKALSLTAGSVIKLDFVTFLAIIKSIFSMYTTLRATMH